MKPDPKPTDDQLPATTSMPGDEPVPELVRIVERYMEALEQGKQPDKAEVLKQHPALASQLEPCFAGLDFIHRANDRTTPSASTDAPLELGPYHILREIGRGGMGVVYEAEEPGLKRRVALKVLRLGAVSDPEAMQRFQREAETVAGLHHTNIVPIFSVGEENGVQYFAMQLIAGRSLAEVIQATESPRGHHSLQRSDPDFYAQVADIGRQASEALEHAHQRGVIHRDIKPSNLILDEDGRVWLTDFGLAKRANDHTLSLTGAWLGTPKYMSPEQAQAVEKPIDHRTDIYSLGATLYELATGRAPFEADSPHRMLQQICSSEPIAPRRVRRDVPRDLSNVITKCLSKVPAGRYASAAELASDLRAIEEGRPTMARRASLVRQAARWAKKHDRVALVASVAALIGMVSVVIALYAVSSWQQRRMGKLVFETDGMALTGELRRHGENDLAVPPFTIPNQHPIEVPEGEYDLLLSGEGGLAESSKLTVNRMTDRLPARHKVAIKDKRSWSIDMSQTKLWRVTQFADGDDIIVVKRDRISRCDGETGERVWQLTIDERRRSFEGFQWRDWIFTWLKSLHDWDEHVFGRDRRLDRTPWAVTDDIDGDRQQDIFFFCESHGRLISGATAEVLWDQKIFGFRLRSRDQVRFFTELDLDQDGARDIVVSSPTAIAAVSGRSGDLLWTFNFAVDRKEKNRPPVIHSVTIDNRDVLAFVGGHTVHALEAHSGEPALPPADIGWTPRTVAWDDLDGDGSDDVLLIRPLGELHGLREAHQYSLAAHSVRRQSQLWKSETLVSANKNEYYDAPWAEDLDQDGQAEVILKHSSHEAFGVIVLEGETGDVLWNRSFGGSERQRMSPAYDRLITGPDLDHDGYRDLFFASAWNNWQVRERYLLIDAFSGRDGTTIWTWSEAKESEGYFEFRGLSLGPISSNGHPTLIAPAEGHGAREFETLLLDVSTGRLVGRAKELFEPTTADVNNDTLPDLVWRTNPLNAAHELTSDDLVAAVSQPPKIWSRPEEMHLAHDLDGDGVRDFLDYGSHGAKAVSGRNGHVLWRWNDPVHMALCPPVDGDIDGDGLADVIVFKPALHYDRTGETPVIALSGRSGKVIWVASDFSSKPRESVQEAKAIYWLEAHDDQPPRIAFLQSRQLGLHLTQLDLLTGNKIWSCAFGDQPFTEVADIADLNGDGLEDFVVHASGIQSKKIVAISGRDGEELWDFGVSTFANANNFRVLKRTNSPEIIDSRSSRLAGLDAASGEQAWTWEPKERPLSYGKRLAIANRGEWQSLIVSSPAEQVSRPGETRERTPETALWVFGANREVRRHLVLPARTTFLVDDLDGNGSSEILMWNEDEIWALGPDFDEERWRCRLPGLPVGEYMTKATVTELETEADSGELGTLAPISVLRSGDEATIVVPRKNKLFGMDAATGKIMWTCPRPSRKPGVEVFGNIHLLDNSTTNPRVAYQLVDRVHDADGMLCYQALPLSEAVTRLTTEPVVARDPDFDPRRVRALPWTSGTVLPRERQFGGYLACLLLIVPIALFVDLRRRRDHRTMAVTYVVCAVIYTAHIPLLSATSVAMLAPSVIILGVLLLRREWRLVHNVIGVPVMLTIAGCLTWLALDALFFRHANQYYVGWGWSRPLFVVVGIFTGMMVIVLGFQQLGKSIAKRVMTVMSR